MTRVRLALEVRFFRIPIQWELRQTQDSNEAVAVPQVDSNSEKVTEIDGFDVRRQFFQLKPDPESALGFLASVGAWNIVEDKRPTVGPGEDLLSGCFGSRYFVGKALPVLLSDLWSEQKRCMHLLRNHSELKARFGPLPRNAPPYRRVEFATQTKFFNELPVHVEWRRGRPFGVAEIITGRELLMATMHVDLLRGAAIRNCARKDCGIPFPVISGHQRKFCDWSCAHVVAVRKARENERKRKELEQRNAKKR